MDRINRKVKKKEPNRTIFGSNEKAMLRENDLPQRRQRHNLFSSVILRVLCG
jgi:hypothetical protein